MTGEKDATNHVGETETKEENIVPGTCAAACTWDDVVYCKSCNEVISTTPMTGEKDPANHVGGTELRDTVTATCVTEGYTGDTRPRPPPAGIRAWRNTGPAACAAVIS